MKQSNPEAAAADVTQLLLAWNGGDEDALERLTPVLYGELYRRAKHYMVRERPNHTLGATALINEVYVRLIDSTRVEWQNRAQFLGICARQMRRILVEFARARSRAKRGGGLHATTLDESAVASPTNSGQVLAIDDALERLQEVDHRKSQVVELRFFGGLTVEETAEVLEVSPFTVIRDWNLAKAWLHREIAAESHDES